MRFELYPWHWSSKNGIFISQRKYVIEIIKDVGLLGASPINTLKERGLKFSDKVTYSRILVIIGGWLVDWYILLPQGKILHILCMYWAGVCIRLVSIIWRQHFVLCIILRRHLGKNCSSIQIVISICEPIVIRLGRMSNH